MIYREIALPHALAGSALCAWQFVMEADDPPLVQHKVPPDGTTNLVLVRDALGVLYSRLIGPSLAGYTVPVTQGWSYAGLRLRPEAAEAVTSIAPCAGSAALVEREGKLAAVWSDLEALIAGGTDWSRSAALLGPVQGPDRSIAASVDLLIASGGTQPIGAVASRFGLGERQFRRRFHAATGVAPKQFAAVQRVRHALILSLDEASWAEIAHEAGFADQPHLGREIKERFGAPPRQVAGYLGGIRHELVAPLPDRFVQDGAARAA